MPKQKVKASDDMFDPDRPASAGIKVKTKAEIKHQKKMDTQRDAYDEQGQLKAEFQKIKDIDKRAREQYTDALDSEYWFTICFQSREMKDEFLRKTKLMNVGDKFLDGLKVAKLLGITLTTPVPPIRNHKKPEKALVDLALEL